MTLIPTLILLFVATQAEEAFVALPDPAPDPQAFSLPAAGTTGVPTNVVVLVPNEYPVHAFVEVGTNVEFTALSTPRSILPCGGDRYDAFVELVAPTELKPNTSYSVHGSDGVDGSEFVEVTTFITGNFRDEDAPPAPAANAIVTTALSEGFCGTVVGLSTLLAPGYALVAVDDDGQWLDVSPDQVLASGDGVGEVRLAVRDLGGNVSPTTTMTVDFAAAEEELNLLYSNPGPCGQGPFTAVPMLALLGLLRRRSASRSAAWA
jgi:hypothetical protein